MLAQNLEEWRERFRWMAIAYDEINVGDIASDCRCKPSEFAVVDHQD
jgi:hypothetical protein